MDLQKKVEKVCKEKEVLELHIEKSDMLVGVTVPQLNKCMEIHILLMIHPSTLGSANKRIF